MSKKKEPESEQVFEIPEKILSQLSETTNSFVLFSLNENNEVIVNTNIDSSSAHDILVFNIQNWSKVQQDFEQEMMKDQMLLELFDEEGDDDDDNLED